MHVFSRSRLRKAASDYPDAATALNAWFKIAEKARWSNLHEVRADYPHADPVGSCVVFNIGGNKYRLIARMDFKAQEMIIIGVYTHEEYDRMEL